MQDFGQSVEMRGGFHLIAGMGDHICIAQAQEHMYYSVYTIVPCVACIGYFVISARSWKLFCMA